MLVSSTVAKLLSPGNFDPVVVMVGVRGNDEDMVGSKSSSGEGRIGTFARCLGGLCAASRLLFGRTVRIVLTLALTESI